MLVYGSRRGQRGYGIGRIFSNFFRRIMPFLEESAITAGKNAVGTLSNVMNDVGQGHNAVESLKKHGQDGLRKTVRSVGRKGIKRVRKGTRDTSSPARKRRRRRSNNYNDIYSD